MQTSLARRQARRLNGGRRRRGAGGGVKAASGIAVILPLFLFGSFLVVGLLGFVGAVAAYGYFSQGLEDPRTLDDIQLNQESIIYDRTGKIELARIGDQHRQIVKFNQIPGIVLDATTTIEDRTFWSNTGFDPLSIMSAAVDTFQGSARGASTITQQLVRQRLLDPSLVADPNKRVERKIKEIIQSIRLTQEFPGDKGKQDILTDYLNQEFYGNNSYGIMAAARGYFGVSNLSKLTLAQATILAAILQSPSDYDLAHNGVLQDDGTLLVPFDSPIVQRRNYWLGQMERQLPLPMTGTTYTAADFEAAMKEPVVVVKQAAPRWKAPHFVWQVRKELTDKLCGVGVATCPLIEKGGLKIVTTLDYRLQTIAEKWVKAAAIVPQSSDPAAAAKKLGMTLQQWQQNLVGRDVHNGALVALDYQTGEVIAYVGSADYYAPKSTKQLQPQFDVLADGWRQAGSAFKPFNYITGINDGTMTAATMFMDVETDFGGGYTPTDADGLERGPVRLRQALQFSLNIPAVKALGYNGIDHVFEMAKKFGLKFQTAQSNAGLSLTLGTQEVHPVDLTTGYATIANGGRYIGRTTILQVKDAAGNDVITPYTQPPAGEQVVSPQADYILTDILAGNTDPHQNPLWGRFRVVDAQGVRRPATLKTGTNNESRDLTAEGFIAPPTDAARQAGAYALAVGVWNGNSDYSVVSDAQHAIFSFDVPTFVWQGFLNDATKTWPISDFQRPDGITSLSVDAFSGMRPGSFTTKTVPELFVAGTEPQQADDTKTPLEVEKESGLLWADGCAGTKVTQGFLNLDNVESAFPNWNAADQDWLARAQKGPGTRGGKNGGITSYFHDLGWHPYGSTWGAPFPPTDTCTQVIPPPFPGESPFPVESPPPVESPAPGESLPPEITPPPVETVVVPDVTGMKLKDAIDALNAGGLTEQVIGRGKTVTGQSPPAGTEVPFGSEVKIILG